ncbi:MAG: AAA family ATPase [Selenomonadaceae bacterium]|nr:AAA family ATPase [Selenomonadaceae bacterium]
MQNSIKPMPVGVEDFKKLREKYHFVDKTRFIRELIDKHSDITLITRPRRFGKTLTMSMLQYFFTVDNAEDNRRLFSGLDIELAGNEYMQEQGSRPVIGLSLKDAARREFIDTLDTLAQTMQMTYEEHDYLLSSPALKPWQQDYFRRILAGAATSAELASSLKHLMNYLATYWKKKPVLLLDEYDAPILAAWEYGYYPQCIDFMRTFLTTALKSNNYLDFSILAGITRVSKESIFSGLNNLNVYTVLSDRYSDIFGFTQPEVDKLMHDCGMDSHRSQLKKWYDGYKFGHSDIYNPWSVIKFIDSGCEFKPYWINVSSNAILKDLLTNIDAERRQELVDLLHGNTAKTPVMENIVYADLHDNRDALFMMLLVTGYLKAIEVYKDKRDQEWALLNIPNREIKIAYENDILSHIAPKRGISLLDGMLEAMTSGNVSKFADKLTLLLKDFVSYHDMDKNPENFYHGLMLGLSVLLDGEYRIESNRESGYGRFDLAFFPLKKANAGVIIELKAAKSTGELSKLAQNAIQQIKDKEYTRELERQGVKCIWKYGIAVHGKNVHIVGV